MSHTVPIRALPQWLADEARDAPATTALLAGHFAIFSAGAAATDYLDADSPVPAVAAEMVDFTRLTWQLGCEAAACHAGAPRLVVLVDDIQFVRPLLNDRGKSEQLAAALASTWLEQVTTLPPYHAALLERHRLDPDTVHRHRPDRWILSERELRQSAVRHVRQQLAGGDGARHGLAASDDGSVLTVSLPEQQEFCVVHSGHTGCAGGYAEMLSTLHRRGIRKVIAMVPMRCLTQVTVGTQLAHQLFGAGSLTVVNVAIADPSLGVPATISRHPA